MTHLHSTNTALQAMIADLRADSARWRQEERRATGTQGTQNFQNLMWPGAYLTFLQSLIWGRTHINRGELGDEREEPFIANEPENAWPQQMSCVRLASAIAHLFTILGQKR